MAASQPRRNDETQAHRPAPRTGGPFVWVPVRHASLPERTEHTPSAREQAARLTSSFSTLAAGVTTWAVTDSVTLAVFWGAFAGYVAGAAFTVWVPGESGRRISVIVLTCAAAVGVLLLTTSAWGPAWYAVVLSLFVGTAAHWAAAWLLARSLLEEDRSS